MISRRIHAGTAGPPHSTQTQQLNSKHMDTVFIKDLDIETVIGIYDWERKIRQTVRLNVEMQSDVAKAAATDHIDDALDYKAVAKRDRKSTRLNSSHVAISYAVFCLKKK